MPSCVADRTCHGRGRAGSRRDAGLDGRRRGWPRSRVRGKDKDGDDDDDDGRCCKADLVSGTEQDSRNPTARPSVRTRRWSNTFARTSATSRTIGRRASRWPNSPRKTRPPRRQVSPFFGLYGRDPNWQCHLTPPAANDPPRPASTRSGTNTRRDPPAPIGSDSLRCVFFPATRSG